MMALPLLRVAVVEPTQNSRLQAGGKPPRPYFPSRKSPPANISLDHLNTAAFNYLLTHEITR
ncbi:MAG: hypothetical protein QOH31_5214 [Verrucomicrobiota bacterium]